MVTAADKNLASGIENTSFRSCSVCHRRAAALDLSEGRVDRGALNDFIHRNHPEWSEELSICRACLNRFRAEFVADAIVQERGELTELEQEVIKSFREQQLVSENTNSEFEKTLTFGQRLADRVAAFGGSWAFLISFAVLIFVWILGNQLGSAEHHFDPYPFILLNLILSCLAAIQAPVIMMSQNRQEAKDRVRAEHDYLINLKAELEIQQLSRKLDQLMSHQWQRLLEIQSIQMELLGQISEYEMRSSNDDEED
jgi:uncharacterized membrane protein